MTRTPRWIATSLLGFLLVMGCNQAQRQPKTLYRPTTVAEAAPAPAPTPAPAAVVVTQLPEPQAQVAEQQPPAPTALPAPAKPDVEMQPANYTVATPKPEKVMRRSFADVSARPGFAHAQNYSWIQGELQYLHSHQCWRVRYASVDEDDKYGGYVVLEESRMNNLQSGQMVRVEGEVAEPSSTETGSKSYRYRVRSIEPMSNP
jgi:hypothetical protein